MFITISFKWLDSRRFIAFNLWLALGLLCLDQMRYCGDGKKERKKIHAKRLGHSNSYEVGYLYFEKFPVRQRRIPLFRSRTSFLKKCQDIFFGVMSQGFLNVVIRLYNDLSE